MSSGEKIGRVKENFYFLFFDEARPFFYSFPFLLVIGVTALLFFKSRELVWYSSFPRLPPLLFLFLS